MTPEQAASRVQRFGKSHPGALRLARLLSFAALAEPGFIRTMRMQFVPESNAGDEADIWFSDLVQSRSPSGVVLFPEVAEVLRGGLPATLRDTVWGVTRTLHRGSRRAIQIEEELTYLGLHPESGRARIDELLRELIGALVGGRSDLANWASRALPRLPAAVRTTEFASILSVAADLRTGRAGNVQQTLTTLGRIPAWIATVLPVLGRVRLAVAWRQQELILGPVVTEQGPNGVQTIEVPDTAVIPLQIRASNAPTGSRSRLLFLGQAAKAGVQWLDSGPVELLTLANETWTLRRGDALQVGGAAAIPVSLRCFTDGRAVTLHWRTAHVIKGCIGFRLARKMKTSLEDPTEPTSVVVVSRTLPRGVKMDPKRQAELAVHQGYAWVDRPSPREGVFSYRVIPILGDADATTFDESQASPWTPYVRPTQEQEGPISVAFNRTLESAAQLDVTLAPDVSDTRAGFLSAISAPSHPLRNALGGDLLAGLRGLLQRALASECNVYVAMFEISDAELLQLLGRMGARANVILAGGAGAKSNTDGNARARAALLANGVKVVERTLRGGHLAHNKFVVVCNASGVPETVWTGNVTWTSSALCTRSNAAVTIVSLELAQKYLDYWKQLASGAGNIQRLSIAGDAVSMAASTGSSESRSTTVRPFFTPLVGRADLGYVRTLLLQARQGILYLLSEPGKNAPVLRMLEERPRPVDRGVYVLGAVRDGPTLTISRNTQSVRLSGRTLSFPLFDALERAQRLPLGWPLQSRMMVIDPFLNRPVVVIGSHSFSEAGSHDNDENFVVIEGDRDVALRCAAHIDVFCQHFLYGQPRAQRAGGWALTPGDAWQNRWLERPLASQIAFWTGESTGSFVSETVESSEALAVPPPELAPRAKSSRAKVGARKRGGKTGGKTGRKTALAGPRKVKPTKKAAKRVSGGGRRRPKVKKKSQKKK